MNKRKAIIYTSPTRSLYIGRLESVLKRFNVASTLLISLEKDLTFVDQDGVDLIKSRSFLIPAGIEVTIKTHHSMVAMCYLDELGQDLFYLIPKMGLKIDVDDTHNIYADIMDEDKMVNCGRLIFDQRPSAETLFSHFNGWNNGVGAQFTQQVDDRIFKAMEYLKAHCDENIPVDEIAKMVNLSVPRLSQLFKHVTGTPIRRYRLWQRVLYAAKKVAKGSSLTDAAIEAGFYDYAQFSKVYRQFMGGCPSATQKNTEIKVLAKAC